MMNFITPILLVAISVGGFLWVIDPMYAQVRSLSEDVGKYNDALDRSKELVAVREELVTRYNSFSKEDLDRLLKMLPDNVDNVRLILDLDSIAAKYGMRLGSLALEEKQDAPGALTSTNQGAYRSISISFKVHGSYETFRQFLRSLETSLRLVDVSVLSFGSAEKDGMYDFDLGITTYWLK